LTLLAGAAHTAGQFTPEEPELTAAIAAMRTAHLPMGIGMVPSLFDIFRDTTAALLRAGTVVNLTWLAGFIGLCWFYAVPPPLISGVLIWPFFLIALLRNR
jgi:hypothetical protein